ncbi:MAG: hypothetical protein JO053_07980 [Acidobacteria bacterium]|nr:hypothetical protein [Acidobacteriota bacterium]
MRQIKTLLIILFVGFLAASAHAQLCPGSHLTYFVRDAKGKLMNANSTRLSFTGSGKGTYAEWEISDHTTRYRTSGLKMPTKLGTFLKTGKMLATGGMCNFGGEASTLKLTLRGKTMELTFKYPSVRDTRSGNFAVDSLPFHEGKYEIDLSKATDAAGFEDYGGFFAATLWKKVP